MEASIQQLIEKEREAEGKIKTALVDKDEARKKATRDAELALSIIQAEHNEKIKEIESVSEAHVQRLREELQREYQSYADILQSKDISKTIEKIVGVVTGQSTTFE